MQSELIRDPGAWWKAWIAPPRSHPDYFPLTTTSFWLDRQVFGERPMGYRIVNTLLHGLAAVALYALLAQLRLPGAIWAAAIFAVHPVNVESVAWISERKNVLAMLFGILAFSQFMKWQANRDGATYALALVIFIAALASKASVVAFPLVFLAFLWWRDRALAWRDLRGTLPFLAASLVFGLLVIHFQQTRAIGEWQINMPPWPSRIASAGLAYWHYLFTTLWPFNLATIYPLKHVNAPSLGLVVLALGTAAAGIALFLSKNRVLRTTGFALIASALLLAPVLGFVKMSFMRYGLVSDHLQQIALPVILSCVVCGVTGLLPQGKIFRKAGFALAVGAVTIFFVASWQRAGVHASNEDLWRDSLAKNPNSAAAHNFLGGILARRGDFEGAGSHFEQAVEIEPGNLEILSNYAYSLMDRGRAEEAEGVFLRAVASPHLYPGSFLGLSEIYAGRGEDRKAVEVLAGGARRFPESMTLNAAAAGALLLANRPEEALVFLEQCLRLDPGNPELKKDIAETRARIAVPTGMDVR